MQESLVLTLRAQRPRIRAQWEALLRAEPVGSPLGHPGTLVHLLDWTLDEIFSGLALLPARRRAGGKSTKPDDCPGCPCGHNPLLAYFVAGQQAMREALILAQARLNGLDPIARDAALEELNLVVHHITRREIAALCGVCQHRIAAGVPCPAVGGLG